MSQSDSLTLFTAEESADGVSGVFTPRRMGAGEPWGAWAPVQIDATAAVTVALEGRMSDAFGWAVLKVFELETAGSIVEAVLRMPENRLRITANAGAVTAAAAAAELVA